MHRKSPAKIWRKFPHRYSLVGSKSNETKRTYYPPILVEPLTENKQFTEEKMPKRAKLVSWSLVHSPPEGHERLKPYVVGILEFPNGEKFTTQLVDVEHDKLSFGDIMIPVFRRIFVDGEDGVIHYGLKWTRP